jgi:basic amino acid/polyamine antiporter, APA family
MSQLCAQAERLMPSSPAQTNPARVVHQWEAVCLIVGLVIGAGIFKTPSLVAQFTQDPGWLITAWVVGAVVSFTGALCYAVSIQGSGRAAARMRA